MGADQQALSLLEALNRRDFPQFMAAFEEDAILDLPDGIRVVGLASFRDTLSAFLLRHDIHFTDALVMRDEAGLRFAVELVLQGRNHRPRDIEPDDEGQDYALPAVIILEREQDSFTRLSLLTAIRL